MHRVFTTVELSCGQELTLDKADSVHIVKVLRMKAGDTLQIIDGHGMAADSQIITANQDAVVVMVGEMQTTTGEPKRRITLYQGMPKGDKLDHIIQKCVELGVYAIQPVEMTRSIAKISAKNEQKTKRYQLIAKEAARQSGRAIIPEVYEPRTFQDAIRNCKNDGKIIFCDEAQGQVPFIKAVEDSHGDLAFWVGPEGGIDEDERQTLLSIGAVPVTLGTRIMRTETCGPAILAAAMCILGEWQ